MPLQDGEQRSVLGCPDPCGAVRARGGNPVPRGVELDIGDRVVVLHASDERAVARVPDRTHAVGSPGGNEAAARPECDGDDPARRLSTFSNTERPRPRIPDPKRAIRTRGGEERPGRIEGDREREASLIERLDALRAVRASQIRIRESSTVVATSRPSAENAASRTRRACGSVATSSPDAASYVRTAPSAEATSTSPPARRERDLRDRLVRARQLVERPAVRHAPEDGAAVTAAGQRHVPRRGDGQRGDRGLLIEGADDRSVAHPRRRGPGRCRRR